MTMLTTVLFR